MTLSRLEVGNFNDIVEWCRPEDLDKGLNRAFAKGVFPSLSGYNDNISREELGEKFYSLGDYKGKLIAIVGGKK